MIDDDDESVGPAGTPKTTSWTRAAYASSSVDPFFMPAVHASVLDAHQQLAAIRQLYRLPFLVLRAATAHQRPGSPEEVGALLRMGRTRRAVLTCIAS